MLQLMMSQEKQRAARAMEIIVEHMDQSIQKAVLCQPTPKLMWDIFKNKLVNNASAEQDRV